MISSESVWEIGTLIAGSVLTGLLLALGHWFPWPRQLRWLHRYTYGVAAIWIGFALWRLLNADWLTVVGLIIIAGAGGFTVIVTYWLDDKIAAIRKAYKAEATDEELQ